MSQRPSHKKAVKAEKVKKEEKYRSDLQQQANEDDLSLQPHPTWKDSHRLWIRQHISFAAPLILYFSPVSYMKFLLWWLLLGFMAEHGLGVVYFTTSLFMVVLFNLDWSGKPRKEGELSAYSVFNPDFKTLEGQLTAEQFDRQLRSGQF